MNKLMGFYELKYAGIPTVRWEEFHDGTKLSDNVLWTVRTAIANGNDYNLPRVVGVAAKEALEEGNKFIRKINNSGIVIYYPYFIAEKSGTIKIDNGRIIIEAVHKDLWNLVTYGYRDVTIIIKPNSTEVSGNSSFLTVEEVDELVKYVKILRGKYREDIGAGCEVYLEWSYAYDCSTEGRPIGDRYLVFYELRVI